MIIDALTDLTLEQLRAMRAEAIVALGKLNTGTQAVTVAGTGRTITFNTATTADLRQWITDLNAAIRSLSDDQAQFGPLLVEF